MSDRDTVYYTEKEVDAQHLKAAVEEALDEDGRAQRTVGRSGDLFVVGDKDPDNYVSLFHIDHGRLDFVPAGELLDRAEDALAQEPFEDYLARTVFTSGTYVYEKYEGGRADVKVAENDDGSGFVTSPSLQNAIDDEDVNVRNVDDGWLLLVDER